MKGTRDVLGMGIILTRWQDHGIFGRTFLGTIPGGSFSSLFLAGSARKVMHEVFGAF